MDKIYLSTNESGNTATITKEMYERLKDKDGYECQVIDRSQNKPEKEADATETDASYADGVDVEKAKEAFAELEDPDFPEHWYSGHYFISDGSVIKGKEDATEAEKELDK